MDPSRISTTSPPHLRPAQAVPAIYGTEPSQYSAVRRSISAPEPRRSWPASSDAWEQQQPGLGPARHMTPQASAAPQARRRGEGLRTSSTSAFMPRSPAWSRSYLSVALECALAPNAPPLLKVARPEAMVPPDGRILVSPHPNRSAHLRYRSRPMALHCRRRHWQRGVEDFAPAECCGFSSGKQLRPVSSCGLSLWSTRGRCWVGEAVTRHWRGLTRGRAGLSPGAPGIGLFGIGIVLQNDAYGELRVIDIVSRVPIVPYTSPQLYPLVL
jgi:hypothetical protein